MNYFSMLLLVVSFQAFAHGDGKPGPHGGHVRMPGPFHTELVIDQKVARVYLLDIAFKNPSVKNSSVSLVLQAKGVGKPVSCAPKESYFACQLPSEISSYDSVDLESKREGIKGKVVTHKLPLVFTKAQAAPMDDHSQH